ncbi:MAG TPA: carboxypeptidase regulatory-like domain-containing protein [Pyrinomonadaceae bacterium]|jgi:hypothetical protein
MSKFKLTGTLFLIVLLALAANAFNASAQKDKTTGSIKGKVKAESGSAEGVRITVRQGEREAASVTTDRKGNFEVAGLAPGRYNITFRKPGLSVAELKDFEVVAGKTRSLGGDLVLPVDEGSIVFIKGSVFNEDGFSLPGAQVDLARVGADGATKKIDGRISTRSGDFAFRLPNETARYRVTAKLNGITASKDVEVDGAAVYRVALSLKTKP